MTTLSRPARFAAPAYDRGALKPRILHVGFGAFARAHLAVYLDDVLAKTGGDWGICAVRLHSGADALADLRQADCLYRVAETDDGGTLIRTIGAVIDTRHPKTDGDAVFSPFVDPALSIVSLTVTEKGYCTDGSGRLDLDHPGIRSDLAGRTACQTAIGYVVEGLARRRRAGLSGVTVLSCDNLPGNGTAARNTVLAFADERDGRLRDWIAETVTFPSTMVDRIVPALTDDARAAIAREAGAASSNDIVCEPFRQWVIEDEFAAGRPEFDRAGAELVADVAPFEEMKLRLLNGSHSFLAYLGALSGHQFIADCMRDPALARAVKALMRDEQMPTLTMPPGTDLDAYAESLITRFSNAQLRHKTTQIATDGSQKLPQRLLAPIRHHLRAGTPWPLLGLAVAGWLAYLRGVDEADRPLPVSDPLAGEIAAIVAANGDGADYVAAMLGLKPVFSADLAADGRFRDPVTASYLLIRTKGVVAALRDVSASSEGKDR